MPPKSGSRVLWALCRLLVPILGAGFIVTLTFNKKSVLNNAKMFNKVADEGLAKTRLQKEVLFGHEVLWELPQVPPKGTLFLAHGCKHQATDFWPASSQCQECLGLPEEVSIRHTALGLGYAVVAVSSADRRGSRCWDVRQTPEQSVDGRGVAAILRSVRGREGLGGLPLYALGASSGGAFVLMLPHLVELQGVIAQIMGVPPRLLHLPPDRTYPPTVFIHMPRDTRTAALVQADLEALHGAGVRATQVEVHPRPLTPRWLTSRSPAISNSTAAGIVSALQQGGLLSRGGLLVRDPREVTGQWQELLSTLRDSGLAGVSLVPDESPVSELLNLAWAGHEIVSDHVGAALEWLARGGEGAWQGGGAGT